eukprot:scaffold1061_cov153-Pinguiococcus_pyrenoidosus.AAC.2
MPGAVRRRDQIADGEGRLDQGRGLDEAVDRGVLRKLPALERDPEDAVGADLDNAAAAVDGVDGFSDPPVAPWMAYSHPVLLWRRITEYYAE